MKVVRSALAAALLALAMPAAASAVENGRIGQGIFISDMDVSGLTEQEARAKVDARISQVRRDQLTVQVGEDSVQTTASQLGLHWENQDIVEQAFSYGNSGNPIKRYKDKKDLQQGNITLPFQFQANDGQVRAFIENECMQFEKKAREATISADGSGGFDLTEGVTGQVINVDESAKILEDFISGGWQGGAATIALAVELDEPKGNAKDLETIQDLLGTYTTYYGSTSGRNANVERAASLINDNVLYPGETFSVTEHLVPFTAENGYELAPEYSMGTVVQGYGGGVCQVSTTLYNALLRAELEIVERHNHTMVVTYVPASMDAAIAEGLMDLSFRNNRETPILISGYAYGGELTFSIWGQETRPADRYVEYSSVVTSETPSGGIKLYAAPDQPVGYFQQVSTPMPGKTAECYKTVTYNGETTTELVNRSTYQATPQEYEVGTLGANNALLTAIAANDLAGAQAAALGITQPESELTTEASTDAAPDANTAPADPSGDTPATDPPAAVPENPEGGGEIIEEIPIGEDDIVIW